VSTSTCVCGYENSAEAKFCSNCARPLGQPALKCPVCGHQNKPGARFCELDATPLDTQLASSPASFAASAPPAPPPPVKTEKPKKRGREPLVGTIVSVAAGTIRLVPLGATDRPVEVKYPMHLAMRIASLAHPGDDIEVLGSMNEDGILEPVRMRNRKTGVLLYRKKSYWALVVFLIVLIGLIYVSSQERGAQTPLGTTEVIFLAAITAIVVGIASLIRRRFSNRMG
jgi:hypothetical protein